MDRCNFKARSVEEFMQHLRSCPMPHSVKIQYSWWRRTTMFLRRIIRG